LQYLSFQWWIYLDEIEESISLIWATWPQCPPSLKALIIGLSYNHDYEEESSDKLDAWFCKNQNDPKSSVVTLAGHKAVDGGLWPTIGSQAVRHKVWGSWAFVKHSPWDRRYYDLCEELLPDGKLTIWEEADRALEERRLQLANQVDGVA
jgi:hypothetical protein